MGGIPVGEKYNSTKDSGYSSESLAKKDAALKKIILEFRAKYPGDVEEKALKGLWKRIKEKTKKDVDQHSAAVGDGENWWGRIICDMQMNPVSEGYQLFGEATSSLCETPSMTTQFWTMYRHLAYLTE